MRKITNWDVFDWNQDGEDRLELWVDIKFLPEDIVKYGDYDFMNGVVDKINENETTPETEIPAKGFRGQYDAHTRYILTSNANARKAGIKVARKMMERKKETDPSQWYIITTYKGAEKVFAKATRIHECKLAGRKRRDRHEGKKICRDEMMRMGV